ncbi:heterodisulfide reductase-related iron-sulfur binding cluster [Leptospirillum ferriphilum]|uniref:4Fe-4S ferredoxin-type domain-containing protein n=2 Tax=Leptospirillum ferriphilum TaxID=178606 RepID=A0A059XSB9_9BACT|nr:heterodisulfide reductase-related iron-sulfur binding cluster [Leptospirillum ferriphilum]AIA31509.1 hypothetical protein Y981_02800 [Leptospirillum ferriphilum YSK]OOH72950.1 hypothetical protein BOX24_06105 [Leptospirillum ferriphilum]OOH80352.1 hypothetical protein BOX30_06035 [Leptospirillum ferriphilum]
MPEENLSDPLDKKWLRVADICNGCRRCFHLCPSFDTLFGLLDRPDVDGDPFRLEPDALARTEDGCNYCKLCYNHCPYCPPHAYQLDFPDLMIRSRVRRKKMSGFSRSDRLLARTDWTGKMGTRFAGTVNAAIRNPLLRHIGRLVAGIDERAPILPFAHETFLERLGKRHRSPKRAPEGSPTKVALFVTCLGNYQMPDIPESVLRILEHHSIPVVVPGALCCGMPYLDAGDLEGFRLQAARVRDLYLPLVREGYQIVVPVPTCQLTLRKEFLQYGREEGVPEDFQELSEHSWDFFQFLEKLRAEGRFRTDFKSSPGPLSYHVACHLRDQNIGTPVREILGQIPGTTIRSVEQCSGHGGTWGMKPPHYPLARKKAEKTASVLQENGPGTWASDCPLAGKALEAASGNPVEHPAVLLRKAYGL